MNVLNLEKHANKLERLTGEARKALVEFKVAKSKWEIDNKKYRIYSSAKDLMSDLRKK